jgi:hypothetical protein
MTTTLTGMYTNTVNLGVGSIADTVTVTGTIEVGFSGGNGIYAAASVSNAYVYNKGGVIRGGSNGDTGQAGAGIYLTSIGNVTNAELGSIFGGQGGSNTSASGYAGGVGVDLNGGGQLLNTSLIHGGAGGSGNIGGYGGNGVNFYGETILPGIVSNQTDIIGGAGGSGSETGGNGGIGIVFSGGGEVYNRGTVDGGADGQGGNDVAGIGVLLLSGGSATNYGTISGGYEFALNATQRGGAGGTGLAASAGGTISNYGLIEGGAGAESLGGTGTAGGIGVFLDKSVGLTNDAKILGGTGGVGAHQGGVGGAGGVGLVLEAATGTNTSNGTITGGAGGMATNATGGTGAMQGGAGGLGAIIEGGARLVNYGLIIGGAGGASSTQSTPNGQAAVGVYVNGGTLTNFGTISGGPGGPQIADSVTFGKLGSTLVIEPGAVFDGDVLANAADTLDLAGTAHGTLTDLGGIYTGFKTINIEAGSYWNFVGSDTYTVANEVMNVDGILIDDANFNDAAATKIVSGGELQAEGGGTVTAPDITLAGGALYCGAQAVFAIGTTAAGAMTGVITLDAGTTLSGFGTIAAALDGSGTLDVTKNTLFLDAVVEPGITATVASGCTLDLRDGGPLEESIGGAGTLRLDGTSYFFSGNGGAAAEIAIAAVVVDSKTTVFGTGTIMGNVANAGTFNASGGNMALGGLVTGSGDFNASSGDTLYLGITTTAGTLSGAGTIAIDGDSFFDAGIKLTASCIEDAAPITLGSATNVTIGAAETFYIGPVTISGAAGDKLTNSGSIVTYSSGTTDIDVAFVNIKSVLISSGSGTIAFLSGVTNNGTFNTGEGELSFDKKISGTGTLAIHGLGTLSLLGGAFATQTVQFEQPNALLDITNPSSFSAPIADFAAHDTIDLLNTASTTFTFAGNTLTLEDGTKSVATLTFTGTYTKSDFATATDNHSGTLITHT